MKFCIACAIWPLLSIAPLLLQAQDRTFTVKDDIQMVRFSDPLPAPGKEETTIAKCSPNGEYFAVVTSKGNLTDDRIESTVWIFDRNKVTAFLGATTPQSAPQPQMLVTVSSFPHREESTAHASVIKDLRWSFDSRYIYYRAESLEGAYRLYRVSMDSSTPQALTPTSYNVTQYEVAGDTIAYRAWKVPEEQILPGDPINADAWSVTGYPLRTILFSDDASSFLPKTTNLFVVRGAQSQNPVIVELSTPAIRDINYLIPRWAPFVASHHGQMVVELSPVTDLPKSWADYQPANTFEQMRFRPGTTGQTDDSNIFRPKQYVLNDLSTGKTMPLIGAPNGYALAYTDNNDVVWSEDDRRVLVTNTFLPLDHVSPAERQRRLKPCAVASVDIPSLEARCLLFNDNGASLHAPGVHVQTLWFGSNGKEVLLRVTLPNQKQAIQEYLLQNGNWILSSSKPVNQATGEKAQIPSSPEHPGGGSLQLVVEQDLNVPPKLWARKLPTERGKMLWDPNPEFSNMEFGEAAVYRWRDRTGYEWTGELVKPVNYVPGVRYPLVIQVYVFFDHEFMTDGMVPSAMSARELASAGIAVLQMQKKPLHSFDDAEAQQHLEGFRSAIESLSSDGLIDPKKVGAVGFSWTCWYVENALIRAPGLFAAAVISDGVDHSYMQYHLWDEAKLTLEEQDEKIIGAKPFGAGLKTWMSSAPGFQLDKVQTPLRIEAIKPMSLLGEWEIYSSLKMQGKPVDMIYFPRGQHIHQKPLERLESQQGAVDWFRFWLQGYVSPNPSKRDQYELWEKQKEQARAEEQLPR